MHHLPVNELVPEDGIPYTLVHPCCQVLVPFGADLTSIHLRLLNECGVQTVYLLDKYDSILRLMAHASNQLIPTAQLRADDIISFPLVDGDDRVIVGWQTEITPALTEQLLRSGLDRITVRRRGGLDEPSYHRFRRAIAEIEQIYELPPEGLTRVQQIPSGEVITEPIVTQPWPAPKRDRAASLLEQVDREPQASRTPLRKEAYLDLYNRAVTQTMTLHHRLINDDKHIDAMSLYPLLTHLINAYRIDRPLLLALVNEQRDLDFICSESVKVTILAINMATTLGYGFSDVLEIAYGAYLADIGMLKIPREIREKQGRFDAREADLLQQHPIHGLELLGKIEGLPISTPVVVYQSHERLDGTGYPASASGSQVHPFAQIVGAADVYQAISSARPHRDAQHPEVALDQVGKLADTGKIQSGVYRSLLGSLSHYPVGSWVRLGDGRLARVVGAGDDPRRPQLEVLTDAWEKSENITDVTKPVVLDAELMALLQPAEAPGHGLPALVGF